MIMSLEYWFLTQYLFIDLFNLYVATLSLFLLLLLR